MKAKKTITSIIAFAMVASTMTAAVVSAITTKAEGTIEVNVSQATVSAGGEFAIDVSLSGVENTESGFAGCEFAVSFDTTYLEDIVLIEGPVSFTGASLKEWDLQPDLQTNNIMISGNEYSCLDYYVTDYGIAVMWATGLDDPEDWVKTDGLFFTITGTVSADAPAGVIDFEITPIKRGSSESEILFGYLDASGENDFYYEVATSNGGIDVDSEVVTTTGTDDTNVTTTTDDTSDTTGGDGETLYGDINLDGKISSIDMIAMKNHLLEVEILEGQAFINADVRRDGKITAADLAKFKNYFLEVPVVLGSED